MVVVKILGGEMKLFLVLIVFSILLIVGCREDIIQFTETEKTGTLFVTSDPEGAEIFLNNLRIYKTTPDSLINLEPGNYNLRLRLNGYPEENVSVNVISGQTNFVSVSFRSD